MSKYSGHIQSIYTGTAGWQSGNHKALRINNFDFGVGWTAYGPTLGPTGDPKFWSLVDPEYSGLTAFGPGLSGQTAGVVVYQYKAANGPSIVSFTAGGWTAFTEYTRAISGSAGINRPQLALRWYLGQTGYAVTTNVFKTIPAIDNLKYAWDADQGMSVVPGTAGLQFASDISYDLSQRAYPVTMTTTAGGPSLSGPLRGVSLPYNLNFAAGGCEADFSSAPTLALNGATEFTISIWVTITDLGSNYSVFYIDDFGSDYINIVFDATVNKVICYWWFGASNGSFDLTVAGGYTGQWQNFTITLFNNSVQGYVDGVLYAQNDTGVVATFGPVSTTVVGEYANPSQGFRFNSVYIWDIDITQQTINGVDGLTFFYEASKDGFIR